ncbi:MAG: hypothetical protein ABI895_30705 [Deltaproteobacteria bacterium]
MPRSPKHHPWLVLGPLSLQVLCCTVTSSSFTPIEVDALRPDAGLSASSVPDAGSQPVVAAPLLDAGANSCTSTTELPSCMLVQQAPVECVTNGDCASLHCQDGSCIAASCADSIVNQGESAVDCAGPCPARCGEGQACTALDDCAPGLFCPEGARTCARISCRDAVRNGDEVGTDCGGSCPPCPLETACTANQDCESGVCRAGACAVQSCDDGILNQDEAALDCGGSCAPCPPGRSCQLAADCDSGVCDTRGCGNGVARCCQPARCNDRVRNGTEAFPDCGNAQCGACPIGSPCNGNAVCDSGLCQNGACRQPPCDDGQQNGLETDTDCGGPDPACTRCALGRECNVTQDCATGSCVAGVCANCGNGVQDGRETDSDCGGVCGPCGPGGGCLLDSECQSGVCVDDSCCGGRDVDCTRCARELATGISCATGDAATAPVCEAFLECLQDNPQACPSRIAPGCVVAGGACDPIDFGGNGSAAIALADRIIGTAQCTF